MTSQKLKRFSIYVLKLEEKRYYIGITSKDPEERFLEHKNGFYGAEWTKLYKPIKIEQSKDLGVTTLEKAEEYENKVTREYVKKYGIDNVRGGNLTYRGRVIKRFGYYWQYEEWDNLLHMLLAALLLFTCAGYILWDQIARH